MSKRIPFKGTALVGVSLVAGCAVPPVSTSGGGGPGMPQAADVQQPVAMAVNSTDQQFVSNLGPGNSSEIALSQLALQHASSQAVRQFAQRMVTDHTQAGQQLQQAASQAGMTVPQDIKPEDQAASQQLSNLSGMAFDRAYMAKMVADHEKTVTLFETEIRQGQNTAIKGFAQQALPTIQDHLRQAREIAGGSQAAPTS
ncbi:MAG TPA: DUF4142 domain-containing protein [Stenomitos sp.]